MIAIYFDDNNTGKFWSVEAANSFYFLFKIEKKGVRQRRRRGTSGKNDGDVEGIFNHGRIHSRVHG